MKATKLSYPMKSGTISSNETYRRDQFLDGNMPELNDQLAVHVRVLDIPPGRGLGDEGVEDHLEPLDKDDDVKPLSREF